MDCSPPDSSVRGIFQARILEWVAISSSRGFSWPRNWTHVSCLTSRFFTAEPSGKPLDNLLFLKYFQKTLPRSCMCCFLSSYCIIPEMPSLHTPSRAGGSLLMQRIQFKVTLTQPGLRSSSSGPPANTNRTYDLLFWLVLYDSSLIEYKLWGPFIHIYHSSAFSVLAQMQEVAKTKKTDTNFTNNTEIKSNMTRSNYNWKFYLKIKFLFFTLDYSCFTMLC